MSHMIGEKDEGVVGFYETYGNTWHRMPQYVVQNGAVYAEEVERVFNFDLKKEKLYRANGKDVNSWCIVRTDEDTVLVPSVGSQFDVISHLNMFEKVNNGLLKKYPELDIESAGTLEDGATAFVNLKLKDMNIKGDDSKNLSRMMFFNPLGRGAYTLGVHNVRIVCNNTVRASEAQAAANNSLRKIRHTSSAADNINKALVDLAQIKLGLDKFENELNELTTKKVDTEVLNNFLNAYVPIPQDISKSAATRRKNKRNRITENFEEALGLQNSISRSKYSLFQAVTYVEDHPTSISKNQDEVSVMWDGMVGARASKKDKALNLLATV